MATHRRYVTKRRIPSAQLAAMRASIPNAEQIRTREGLSGKRSRCCCYTIEGFFGADDERVECMACAIDRAKVGA